MNYYKEKENQLKQDIYEILSITYDKHLAVDAIFLIMKKNVNIIADIVKNGSSK